MRVCLITNIVSPHQIPLAQELVKLLGKDHFRYITTDEPQQDRMKLGWGEVYVPNWVLQPAISEKDRSQASEWANNSDVVLCGNRDIGLFERRCRLRKTTFYMSERWFKPPIGMMRLLHPCYFTMAARMFRLLASPYFYNFVIGTYSARDMQRMVCFFCLLYLRLSASAVNEKLRLWGYFVESSAGVESKRVCNDGTFKILWFGRLIGCKRTDLLIEAVKRLTPLPGLPASLKIVGYGIKGDELRRMVSARGLEESVEFVPPKPITEIRVEIRSSDTCVVSSDGREGWSVAVNEALIEGCCTIASDATGAGATLIQDGVNGLLFKSGSVDDLTRQLQRVREDRQLRERLAKAGQKTMLNEWTPGVAAERLLALADDALAGRELRQWASGPLSVV